MAEFHLDITEVTLRTLKSVLDPYRVLVETLHAQGRLTPNELQTLTDAVKAAGHGPQITKAALPRLGSDN